MRPRGALGPGTTRTLLALIRVYERDGRATVRAVAREAGRSIAATHFNLVHLIDWALIDWTMGERGTLRPLVGRVAA